MSSPSPWSERRPSKAFITEDKFRPLLTSQARDFARISNGILETTPEQWTQRQLFHLYRSATEVETFLDDFGAKRNQSFYPLREMVAMVRWFSYALSCLIHVHGRLPHYQVPDPDWTRKEFAPAVRKTALQLGAELNKCTEELRQQWLKLGLAWPDGALRVDSLAPGSAQKQLPNDRLGADQDSPASASQSSDTARLANHFLRFGQAWSSVACGGVEGLEELRAFMERHCTESLARRVEGRAHNLQCTYDTLVAGTPDEEQYPDLPRLRGAASQMLHLLEAVTALAHLYERHDVYERNGETRSLFSRTVDEASLLDAIVNGCIFWAYESLRKALPVARAVIEELTVDDRIEVELPEGLSLHARPLALLVGIAQHHGTPLEVETGGQKCSGASIMQLLVLAGSHPGERKYTFYGDAPALRDIELLFAARMGEDGTDRFPAELDYLRAGRS